MVGCGQYNYYQEYIIGREGRVSYSIYYCANALRIIKFEWLTQTNCETHQYWGVLQLGSTQVGCPRPIIGQHSLNYKMICVVYYSLQGYTDLIIRNAFAQQYTE